MKKYDIEIKNCLFMPKDGEQDAVITMDDQGFHMKLHEYALIPKSEYKKLCDDKASFPMFLLYCILILASSFILYLYLK